MEQVSLARAAVHLVVLPVVATVCFFASEAKAEVIERDLSLSLGTIAGVFGDVQTLGNSDVFFDDDPIFFDVGDTLILSIFFDQRVKAFDLGEPTLERFTFHVEIAPGTPGFNGAGVSTIEPIGAQGDLWTSITLGWVAGGAGFGWPGQGINITSSEGSFSGIRWTTTLNSANEGTPMTLRVFSGVAMLADGIQKLPLLDAGTLLEELLLDVTGVGPGKSLVDKVTLALTYYDVSDVRATCAVLVDLEKQIRAQKGKSLANELADALALDVRAIMTVLGCE